jgi:protocatechuate 3,4-dioxygenase, beta subunit
LLFFFARGSVCRITAGMNSTRELISRRAALSRALAFTGGAGIFLDPRVTFGADPDFTPEVALGPFYPIRKPVDKDSDLTQVRGRKGMAKGQMIYVAGRITNLKGAPAKDARLEVWQANNVGRYAHPGDDNPAAPLDPNFQGYAVIKTNRDGEFRFKTVKPGAYPAGPGWERPPHIHFDITTGVSRLVTQMFFPGEPLNEKDELFKNLGPFSKFALASVQSGAKQIEDGAIEYRWDIVLFEK